MKTQLKRLLVSVWPVFALFASVTLLDLLLQRGSRTQLEEFFDNPFLDAISYVWVSVKWGLLLASSALFAGRFAKWLVCPLWVWLVFVESIECAARCWYGMSLDGDWLMIVLTGSGAEMAEFFSQFGILALMCVPLVLVALAAGLAVLSRRMYPRASLLSVALGAAFCLPFTVCNIVLSNPLAAANEAMYAFLPVDTVHNCATFRDIVRTANSPRIPPSATNAAERIAGTLGVFVIGESATRGHWHLYGYGRPTTPVMDGLRGELVVFRDVRATHSTTGKSLRMMLTEATRESPDETKSTFPQQCMAAGYGCSLLSSHSRWGRWEGVETLLFSGCERKVYLHELPGKGADALDDELLPLLDGEIAHGGGRIVFVHLMGSHAPPVLRYPLKRSIYPRYDGDLAPSVVEGEKTKAAMADVYDNSVAFTDLILGAAVERIRATKRAGFLVYVSDHGETPGSGFWRDRASPELFEVPCIVWFSREYRERYPATIRAIEGMASETLYIDRLLPIFRLLAHLETQ